MSVITGMPTKLARHYQSGGKDAYDVPPERAVSDGVGNPCRHCLDNVPKGEDMLILAYCPFDELQPYAETGPVFLCANQCNAPTHMVPPVLTNSPDYLLKGYSPDQRIVYGTGQITPREDLVAYADDLLQGDGIAFVDVRSSRNNCWLARISRE